jgi:hypothetical protein
MHVPCPMLRDGACSVYASRPIVCRTATSFDASSCERSYGKINGEAVPQSGHFLAMRDRLCLALSGALKRCGLPHCGYEMQEALTGRLQQATPKRDGLAAKIFSRTFSAMMKRAARVWIVIRSSKRFTTPHSPHKSACKVHRDLPS